MAKNKKSSLKNALSSQQSRLKKKQDVKQAAEHQAKMSKGKNKAPPLRSTIPFRATDKVLLIGEGNFSFAQALLLHAPLDLEHIPPQNVTATAYDSEDECYAKYSDAEDCVRRVREKGAEVLFGVDATKLEKCARLKGRTFDRIVWNFPHAGEDSIFWMVQTRRADGWKDMQGKGITDQDRNVLSNQLLILGFLRSAAKLLTAGPIPQPMKSRKRKPVSDEDQEEELPVPTKWIQRKIPEREALC